MWVPGYYFSAIISSLVAHCKCSPSELPWRLLARPSAADKKRRYECEENIKFSLKVPGVSCKDLLPEYVRLALYFLYFCTLLLAPKSTASPELWYVKIQRVLKKVENKLIYLSHRNIGDSSLHFWFSLKAETKVMAAGQVLQIIARPAFKRGW